MPISVLLADPRADSCRDLEIMLSRDSEVSVVGSANDRRSALDLCRQLRPAVVLLDGALLGGDSLSILDEIAEANADTATIVLLDGADMELMRRLMRAGARDCLMRPVSNDDLLSAVRHVHTTAAKQRDFAAPPSQDPSRKRGDVIAIYSPQGGAGKSMLSANLAVALAKILGAEGKPPRVALVDLNLQFGDIDLMLNLSPQNTIAGLAQKGHGGIDAELLEQYLTVHPESGLKVLVAPSTPQYAESITVYTVEQVIDTLRDNYDVIIVDTPSQLQDTTLAVLDAAKTVLLLTSLDLLALHKTRTALEMLRQLYTPEKIQPVLNRANSDVGISLADVENVLGVKMISKVPSDGRIVVRSINEGKPFVIYDPTTPIAKEINRLAHEILGLEAAPMEEPAKKGGFLKKMFS